MLKNKKVDKSKSWITHNLSTGNTLNATNRQKQSATRLECARSHPLERTAELSSHDSLTMAKHQWCFADPILDVCTRSESTFSIQVIKGFIWRFCYKYEESWINVLMLLLSYLQYFFFFSSFHHMYTVLKPQENHSPIIVCCILIC